MLAVDIIQNKMSLYDRQKSDILIAHLTTIAHKVSFDL
jgi:hypothetical protein